MISQLQIKTAHCYHVFAIDSRGQPIPPDKVYPINVCVTNSLTTSSGTLSFVSLVMVNKSMVSKDSEADALAVSWLSDHLPLALSQAKFWNFFEPYRTPCGGLAEIINNRTPVLNIDVGLTDAMTAHLISTTEYINKVQHQFESAKQRLRKLALDNSPFGFKSTVSEARRLFLTLQRVLTASADMGGSNVVHVVAALKDYEELAQRKVESNPGYQQALSNLRSFTYLLTFPTTWASRPVL